MRCGTNSLAFCPEEEECDEQHGTLSGMILRCVGGGWSFSPSRNAGHAKPKLGEENVQMTAGVKWRRKVSAVSETQHINPLVSAWPALTLQQEFLPSSASAGYHTADLSVFVLSLKCPHFGCFFSSRRASFRYVIL